MIALGVAGAVGWILAAFATALWFGERGRRKDLQWLVGHEREQQKAKVAQGQDAETQAIEILREEEKKALIGDLMRESGASYNDAAEEAERLLARAGGLGSDEY